MQRESMTIVTLWRGSLSRPCHSEKEIEAAMADGFVPYNPKDHEYPRFLYSGGNSTIVHSAEEEASHVKQGWQRTPGADYLTTGTIAADEPVAPAAAPNSDITAILSILASMEERIQSLENPKPKTKKAKDEE